jgi:hypothetical protein
MCEGCYDDDGRPALVSQRTLLAVDAICRVYAWCSVGGNVHAQLDDWNLEDEHFEEFVNYQDEAPAAQVAAERACFDRMAGLSIDERASALAMAHGMMPLPVGWTPTFPLP